jgi:hypothetical protein
MIISVRDFPLQSFPSKVFSCHNQYLVAPSTQIYVAIFLAISKCMFKIVASSDSKLTLVAQAI